MKAAERWAQLPRQLRDAVTEDRLENAAWQCEQAHEHDGCKDWLDEAKALRLAASALRAMRKAEGR